MKKSFLFAFILTLSLSCNTFAENEKKVIPGGQTVGICIMTEGLLVIDTEKLSDENGKETNPSEKAGIKIGDRIISADGNTLNSSEQLSEYVQNRKNDIFLTLKRNDEIINTVISPVKTADGYRLGIWIRDSTAGIGTMTYIDPESGNFGALGHGISDTDTNTLLNCRKGTILNCSGEEPTKGEKGTPGELNARFGEEKLGSFTKNCGSGLFGKVSDINAWNNTAPVEVASFDELSEGEAKILADVDGNGVFEYTIDIKKFEKGDLNGKNIVFKVTDDNLIAKTGGIVQGMSGSPIIQNGKLIGAVTHV